MNINARRIAFALILGLVFSFVSTAYSQPNISVVPVDHNFGNINTGSVIPKAITITNSGTSDLLISSIHITPAGEFFKGIDTCSGHSLTPTSTCTVEVRFLPITEGLKSSELSIPSNDPDTPTQSVTLSGTGTIEPVFSDCPEDYWAEDFIHTIYYGDVTRGCLVLPTLQYCPADPVTREQMAAFIVRAVVGEPVANYCGGIQPFDDVLVESPFCGYIKRLSELNITQGCTVGLYCPSNNVTREQMAAFLVRAVEGEPNPDYCGLVSPFDDVLADSLFWGPQPLFLCGQACTEGTTTCPDIPASTGSIATTCRVVYEFGVNIPGDGTIGGAPLSPTQCAPAGAFTP
jgi:hypothetical protein